MTNFNYFQTRIQSEVTGGEFFELPETTLDFSSLDRLMWMNFQIDYTTPCQGLNLQIGQCEIVLEEPE